MGELCPSCGCWSHWSPRPWHQWHQAKSGYIEGLKGVKEEWTLRSVQPLAADWWFEVIGKKA